jgi:NAD(P)-dependent dehydrogenase (short-subunit alcohol dehydrogenase family)
VDGKVALVTGAARGIGAEAARRLARLGARVALVGLEPEELGRVAEECGPEAAAFHADVTDREAVAAAVDGAVERFGGIDVMVSNAGIGAADLMLGGDPDAFERTIEVNLLGSYRAIAAALPHVVERRGYILQIASLAAVIHLPVMASYTASKAGVEAMCHCLRHEVGHRGVDVGIAYFSWIATDLVRVSRDESETGRVVLGSSSGRLRKTYPVSAAGDAIVRAVEHRARTVVVPRGARGLMMLRPLLPMLTARGVRRIMPKLEAAMRAERGA